MAKIDYLQIQRQAREVRVKLGAKDYSPINIFSLISNIPELTLVFYPFNEDISGMCVKKAKLIAINSNSVKARQNFSLAHELYHYFFDADETTISYFSENKHTPTNEVIANHFASYLLMPDISLYGICESLTNGKKRRLTLREIINIEQFYQVSRSALLIRLLRDGFVDEEELREFSMDVLKNARKLGFDLSLYLRDKEGEPPRTYGAYIQNALKLFETNKISVGKYEQYLFEAGRDDIVFSKNGDNNNHE